MLNILNNLVHTKVVLGAVLSLFNQVEHIIIIIIIIQQHEQMEDCVNIQE